jgi:NADPH2:quinone reductase
MAVQIAKAAGANVIATASTSEKLGVAKRFGADYCVNYTSEEWWKEILDLTNGKGVDVVYDSVGLVDKSLKCIKHMGRMLIIGFAGREGDIEQIAMNRVLLKQVQIIGYVSVQSSNAIPANSDSDTVRRLDATPKKLRRCGKD